MGRFSALLSHVAPKAAKETEHVAAHSSSTVAKGGEKAAAGAESEAVKIEKFRTKQTKEMSRSSARTAAARAGGTVAVMGTGAGLGILGYNRLTNDLSKAVPAVLDPLQQLARGAKDEIDALQAELAALAAGAAQKAGVVGGGAATAIESLVAMVGIGAAVYAAYEGYRLVSK